MDWHIEEDSFTENTPIGMKRFTNVIATKDPTAARRVVLSAHFDSKYFSTYPQNQVSRFTNLLNTLKLNDVVRRSNGFRGTLCDDAGPR